MSCEICGKGSCTRTFHSLAEQDEFDERQEMSDDVEGLQCEIQALNERIKELESELEEIKG